MGGRRFALRTSARVGAFAAAAAVVLALAGNAVAGTLCEGWSVTFETQPSRTLAAASIDPAVQVKVVDCADSTPVEGVTISLGLAGGDPGATLGGDTLQTTGADGIATFDDLEVDLPGAYQLNAFVVFLERVPLGFEPPPPDAVSQEFEVYLQLAIDTIDDTEDDVPFPVTVRTVNDDGDEVDVPANKTVTLTAFTCLDDPCDAGATLGGTPTFTITAGTSAATTSVSYPIPQNFVFFRASDTTAGPQDFTLEPGDSNLFNVYDELEERSISTRTWATNCTDTTALNPVCVTVSFLTGGTAGDASLIEASCLDGTGETCLGAIAGLVGDLENKTWKLKLELDKGISGSRGASSFVFTYTLEVGGEPITVRKCKRNGKPNPGEKICLDSAHRDGSGDTVFTFIGVGDPFLKGK